MGYADDYFAIIDEIINKLRTAPELTDIKSVIFGEKERIGSVKFPCIFVLPANDKIEVAATNTQEHNYTVEVVIIQKKKDMEEGLREAIDLTGKCYDVILQDRTLNNTCADLIITDVEPDYQRADHFVLHWTMLRINIKKLRRG